MCSASGPDSLDMFQIIRCALCCPEPHLQDLCRCPRQMLSFWCCPLHQVTRGREGGGARSARYPRPSRNASCARATHGVVERRGWTAGTTRGGVGHLGLTHTETQRGRLWTTGGGAWAAKTVKRPPQQPAQPRYANYWALLTNKRHPPQPAQPQHTNHWALRTRKRHQQEHWPQRPTEGSDPMQQGITVDYPGPRKATRRNVTQGGRGPDPGGGGGHTAGIRGTGDHAVVNR